MSRFSLLHRVSLLLFLLSTPAFAQVSSPSSTQIAAPQTQQRALPSLSATPAILDNTGTVTLNLPAGFVPPKGSRIALFEAGRPARVAEIRRDFALQADGTRTVTLRVNADSGLYEWRLVASDKLRTPLTAPASLLVPGLRREAGWWLFNGSPFVEEYGPSETPPTTLQFLSGLQRGDSKKAPKPQNFVTSSPLAWQVIDLPPLSHGLREPVANLATSTPILGFILRANEIPSTWDEAKARDFIRQLRQSLQSTAPGAALISYFPSGSDLPGPAEWFATHTDAAVLEAQSENFDLTLWQLKVLRRIAEEQPHFDLPIFVRATNLSPAQQIDALMSGATGFIGAPDDSWQQAMVRNLWLFLGSATFEDFAIWPGGENSGEFYTQMRDAGRIPLLGRLKNEEKDAESLALIWNERISAAQLEQLRKFANVGARIYIEGAPTHHNPAFNNLVGAEIGLRAGILDTTMRLDDTWIFGTLRGQELPVTQNVTVTLKPGTIAGQARAGAEKGRDVATGPRAVATLADGSPALIINPVGKGEIIWLPHRVLTSANQTLVRNYYRAIAERVQPSMVEIKTTSASSPPLRTALRRSAKGTLLLSIINRNAQTVTAQATVPANASIALDLLNERELPVSVRGFASTINVSIPANSTTLIAFAPSRAELDTERFALRLQAKLR